MTTSIRAAHPAGPAAAIVRAEPCHLCRAAPGAACTSSGDHLARWLGAHAARRISREQLTGVIACLVVITRWRVINTDSAASRQEPITLPRRPFREDSRDHDRHQPGGGRPGGHGQPVGRPD